MLSGDFGDWVKVLGLAALLDEGLHPCLGFDGLSNWWRTSLTADLAAFWQISVRSAPEKPSVMVATKLRSTSLAMGVFLRLALRMLRREGWSGRGM